MKKNQKIAICSVIISLFTLLVGLQNVAFAAKKMPEFSLESIAGNGLVTDKDFKDKVTLVVFFATWCQPCVIEIPGLIKMQEEYGGEKFSVLGFSVDVGDVSVVKQFAENKKINYPIVSASRDVVAAFGGIYSIPVSFLVDKEGNVVKRYVGYQTHGVFERDVLSLL